MNKTITISRTDDEAKHLILALEKGYKENILESFEKVIKEAVTDDDGNITEEAVTELQDKEVPNPQSATEFIAEYYKKMIDSDIFRVFSQLERKALQATREQEDKAIDNGLHASLDGSTNVEIN